MNDEPNNRIRKHFIFAALALMVSFMAYSTADELLNQQWTYIVLTSNFSTSSATSVNVGLNFTPLPDKNYEVESNYMVRSPILETVGARPGNNWSDDLVDGVVFIRAPALQTTVIANCNINMNCIAPVGGLDFNTSSYPGYLNAIFKTGLNASGKFEITLASETEGTLVMMMKGSYLKYRVYP